MVHMTKTQSTSPDWTLGLSLGLAVGMGFAAVLTDLLLGVTLSACFGVALAYTLPQARRAATAAQ
ncbi:hypothetical protein K1J57_10750 [Nocardiopsis sp. MT53]|uniref:Glycine zipper family protein n=2 Tax=Nocardiopsidaceae TaxID=83676 RepID=A0ABX8BN95_9ACTN|nr:hypothetical protein HUT17_01450 [Nocardiopsis flavescens]QUX23073.1 hypothetical protein KGD84_01295 [Nocardiopsis changdeensis]QYX39018.1 hypothetical protein K1J57_10750 [Nocardiopsis sp. MT53]